MEIRGKYVYFDCGRYPDGTQKLVPIALEEYLKCGTVGKQDARCLIWGSSCKAYPAVETETTRATTTT